MKLILILCSMLILQTACMQRVIHQGNVFKKGTVWLIQEGDTKFEVENAWGDPAIKDVLHPNRVHYVEQLNNPKTGEKYTRGIIVEYDNALRVQHLTRYGFDDK